VEYQISSMLRRCQIARQLPTCSEAVKYSVFPQDGVAVGADENACLSVPEDVIFFQQT